jgi:hypothetical protein
MDWPLYMESISVRFPKGEGLKVGVRPELPIISRKVVNFLRSINSKKIAAMINVVIYGPTGEKEDIIIRRRENQPSA